MPPKVTISVPSELNTTAREQADLNRTFKTRLQGILRTHVPKPGNAIWNVNRVETTVIVTRSGRKRAAKKAAKKKAGKKR